MEKSFDKNQDIMEKEILDAIRKFMINTEMFYDGLEIRVSQPKNVKKSKVAFTYYNHG